ncbi:MAG: hypothetical protein JSW51_11550 [Gemmatimonadota bacterium]|nr:MAG: hypothetical protein JSW51_11550 [Gemmatimonadota bacterium]
MPKLSSKAQRKLDALDEARRKWDRIHSLVELCGSQPTGHDMYLGQIRRAAQDVGRVFMTSGNGPLADQANQMVLATKRGGTIQTKLRAMRELVVSVRGGLERAERSVHDEEKQGVEA